MLLYFKFPTEVWAHHSNSKAEPPHLEETYSNVFGFQSVIAQQSSAMPSSQVMFHHTACLSHTFSLSCEEDPEILTLSCLGQQLFTKLGKQFIVLNHDLRLRGADSHPIHQQCEVISFHRAHQHACTQREHWFYYLKMTLSESLCYCNFLYCVHDDSHYVLALNELFVWTLQYVKAQTLVTVCLVLLTEQSSSQK